MEARRWSLSFRGVRAGTSQMTRPCRPVYRRASVEGCRDRAFFIHDILMQKACHPAAERDESWQSGWTGEADRVQAVAMEVIAGFVEAVYRHMPLGCLRRSERTAWDVNGTNDPTWGEITQPKEGLAMAAGAA